MTTTLSGIGEIFDGPHATPKRLTSGSKTFLNISSLNQGRLDLDQSDWISDDEFTKWTRRVTPQPGDLLFSYETRLGEAALMPTGIDACLGRRMALLRPDTTVVDSQFLLYFWMSPYFKQLIDQRAIHGATVDRIPLSELGDWPVTLPTLKDQHAIAEVLGALDEKIAANSRTMLISQQLIMSMYQSLPTEGGAHLQDITVVRKNKSEPEEIEPNETYIGLEHLTRRSIWANKTGIGSDATSTKSIFHTGDTLFGKLRPYFHKVAIAPTSGVCSTDILVLSPTINELSPLVLAAANDDATVERAVQNSNGTRMPRAKWADISTTPVPNPDATETKHFCAKADELIDLCRSLIVESRTLAATRDELLPLLMSGKITVADAEKRIAE
ncbi:restriction endonuclease subunit S [Corynebacterium variabile]|uniref:restriction endonuclease subunit S n=1 Tax=Corynebacterium variabile TaxID=1727 RepID=UPI003F90503A